MYLQLDQPPKKCSQCGAVNDVDAVNRTIVDKAGRHHVHYLHCRNCHHEKEISRVTLYANKPVLFAMPPRPEFDLF